MSEPLTNLGLYGNFSPCEKDIIQKLNLNFQLLDNLVQLAFNDIVAVLPEDPVEGDKYILSTNDTINLWNGDEWISYPAQEGYIGFNKDDQLIYFYNGTNWVPLPAELIFFDNSGTGLTSTNMQDAMVELYNLFLAVSTPPASSISYNNATSGLAATNVQTAIDEVDGDLDVAQSSIVTLLSQISALLNYAAVTLPFSIATTNQVVLITGATGTITLPTAVGNSGKVYKIIHGGSSFSQVYSIATTSGQTVGGFASSAYALYSFNEVLVVVSDGANYRILEHYAETDWINTGTVTIGATTTAPTKASSRTKDALYLRRSGRQAFISLQYKQGASTGSAAGSGGYLWSLPTNVVADTAITGTNTSASINAIDQAYGTCVFGSNTAGRPGFIQMYSSTQFTMWGLQAGGEFERGGSAFFALNASANIYYGAELSLPIVGWRP